MPSPTGSSERFSVRLEEAPLRGGRQILSTLWHFLLLLEYLAWLIPWDGPSPPPVVVVENNVTGVVVVRRRYRRACEAHAEQRRLEALLREMRPEEFERYLVALDARSR